jgi:hypothetical protein
MTPDIAMEKNTRYRTYLLLLEGLFNHKPVVLHLQENESTTMVYFHNHYLGYIEVDFKCSEQDYMVVKAHKSNSLSVRWFHGQTAKDDAIAWLAQKGQTLTSA